uniref:Uncharacterized protein n=1 Tax=Chromera velia CCMP2878 TaxID=1169474 RepID=A0A0G4HML1_9ALVE|eukprot:Cvel_29337.t1-p1 / transcript=Cvel_29337.t1 / gene=Cvel_29337 / organism=Chromera_velia_CCMP2878 / gene_product=hypothetical protein / transcript_product=hypothetical protein / location=Cvel_scaffold3991:763-3762(-) / protein_length=156 / sequence_SO=supercontig / SO=protein_coding / is_pseudo=false
MATIWVIRRRQHVHRSTGVRKWSLEVRLDDIRLLEREADATPLAKIESKLENKAHGIGRTEVSGDVQTNAVDKVSSNNCASLEDASTIISQLFCTDSLQGNTLNIGRYSSERDTLTYLMEQGQPAVDTYLDDRLESLDGREAEGREDDVLRTEEDF